MNYWKPYEKHKKREREKKIWIFLDGNQIHPLKNGE